jgi:hypothetical protein
VRYQAALHPDIGRQATERRIIREGRPLTTSAKAELRS